eukprot:20931-Heterococcus_DN1.PRE.1
MHLFTHPVSILLFRRNNYGLRRANRRAASLQATMVRLHWFCACLSVDVLEGAAESRRTECCTEAAAAATAAE